jgi:hypothetical protein
LGQVWIGDVVSGLADRMPRKGLAYSPFNSTLGFNDRSVSKKTDVLRVIFQEAEIIERSRYSF